MRSFCPLTRTFKMAEATLKMEAMASASLNAVYNAVSRTQPRRWPDL